MLANIPELLAPAGNWEKFETALLYGANAVYLGGSSLNLRAVSAGLDPAQLGAAVKIAEARQAKVYYCLNSLPRQADLESIAPAIEEAAACAVHAFIVADPGVLRLARRLAPQVPLHLSTQANTSNSAAAEFWRDQGVTRLNLARELSGPEIAAIAEAVPNIELEMFVHGAMCLAVSGQCLLSAWLNERPANLGRCTQPCRFDYRALRLELEEESRPGAPLWAISENEKFSSFLAPQDLCLLPYLPWCIKQGLTALKIEGRAKSAAYVAQVADAYSSALRLLRETASAPAPEELENSPFMLELAQSSSRPLCSGFFLPGQRKTFESVPATQPPAPRLLAKVVEPHPSDPAAWVVDIKSNWQAVDNVELMLPGLKRPLLPAGSYCLENHRGEKTGLAACGTRALLYCEQPELAPRLEPGIFIRSRS